MITILKNQDALKDKTIPDRGSGQIQPCTMSNWTGAVLLMLNLLVFLFQGLQ